MFHFRLLCDLCVYPFQAPVETKFDDLFGTSAAIDPFNFNSQNGMRKDDKWVSLQEQSDMNKHLLYIKLAQALRKHISGAWMVPCESCSPVLCRAAEMTNIAKYF